MTQPSPRYRAELPRLVKSLVRNDPEGAWSLLAYQTLTSTAANDNDPAAYAEADDNISVLETERRHRIRPTERELRDAMAGQTVSVVKGNIVRLGDLVFDVSDRPVESRPEAGGLMIEWGRSKRGHAREPVYETAAERGSVPPKRSAGSIAQYLALPEAELQEGGLQRPMSGEPALLPQHRPRPGVAELRAIAQAFGVDASVSFEEARSAAGLAPSARCPPGVATGAHFIAGVISTSGAQTIRDQPDSVFLPEDPREALDSRTLAVLEEALAGGALRDIGRLLGASTTYAAKAGAKAFTDAIGELKAVLPPPRRVANDNAPAMSVAVA